MLAYLGSRAELSYHVNRDGLALEVLDKAYMIADVDLVLRQRKFFAYRFPPLCQLFRWLSFVLLQSLQEHAGVEEAI